MISNNLKNNRSIEQDNKQRICHLYGVCGKEAGYLNSHLVSHFGLKKLNERKD